MNSTSRRGGKQPASCGSAARLATTVVARPSASRPLVSFPDVWRLGRRTSGNETTRAWCCAADAREHIERTTLYSCSARTWHRVPVRAHEIYLKSRVVLTNQQCLVSLSALLERRTLRSGHSRHLGSVSGRISIMMKPGILYTVTLV